MLARLLHVPLSREIGQPLLTLLSLKIDLTWFIQNTLIVYPLAFFLFFGIISWCFCLNVFPSVMNFIGLLQIQTPSLANLGNIFCGNNVSCYVSRGGGVSLFRTQNLCLGSKNVFDSRQKHFLFLPSSKFFFFDEQQNLFLQHMFPARLNWETFASATIFPSLARPLGLVKPVYG